MVEPGRRVSLRAKVLIYNQLNHVCCSEVGRTLFLLEAELPTEANEVAVLYGKVGHDKRGTTVSLDQFSHVLNLRQMSVQSMFQLKEVCTGIGGLGIGAEASGFTTKACLEKQKRFCEVLRKLVAAEVVEGDMSWLELLGWAWVDSCVWVDQFGAQIDLFATPIQEVTQRILEAFQQRVGQRLCFREGFHGLENVDAATTCGIVKKLPEQDQGLIRSLHSGNFITGDQTGRAHQTDEESWKCKFCGTQDSLQHRHWECEATAWSRQQLSDQAIEWIGDQPSCVSERGWYLMPDAIAELRRQVALIPDSTGAFVPAACSNNRIYAFTDGSGRSPTVPQVRLVAWAWVMSSGVGFDDFVVMARGGVPGRWQTVVRAEACAVISACKFAIQEGRPLTVFSDSDLVVKKIQKIIHGWEPTPLCPDHDVWEVVSALLRQVSQGFQCIHEHSHQDRSAMPEAEQWVCRGNAAADVAAEEAFEFLHPNLRAAHAAAQSVHQKSVAAYQEMLHHFVRVGQQSIITQADHDETKPRREVISDQVTHEELHPSAIVECIRSKVPAYMQIRQLSEWMSWFQALEAPRAPVRLVSWIELMFHFQATTGCVGMRCDKGTTGNRREWVSITGNEVHDTAKLSNSFGQFGWNMIRLWDKSWRVIHARPLNHRIQFWTSCIPIRVADGFDEVIHDHFRASSTGSVRSSKALAVMPLATPA
eukprot:Skav215075  [mRNA]  locus=scaffold2575:79198:88931:+ [translate_table: standard]